MARQQEDLPLMQNFMMRILMSLGGGIVAMGLLAGPVYAQDPLLFLSTQLSPSAEAAKMRGKILKDFSGDVLFQPNDSNLIIRQITVEDSSKQRPGLFGGMHSDFASLAQTPVLSDVRDALDLIKNRGVAENFIDLGTVGGEKQLYIPWMQATYLMVADKRALPHLPAGADINSLTYEQLVRWGANIHAAVGEPKIGLPVGRGGLIHRFVQGYLYPSYTGGTVRGFRSNEALAMWNMMGRLWQHVTPRSLGFASMDTPLTSGEVWIAWDHTARLKKALDQDPDRFVAFPAPSGPKGRGFMAVIAGLGVPVDAPDRAASLRLIDHLTKPATQAITMREVGFFPVVDLHEGETLPAGLKLLSDGVALQSSAPDALPVLLPMGLGDKGGAFSTIYTTVFSRIVLRGKAPARVLNQQAAILQSMLNETGAKCWPPDASSTGPCPVQ